MLTVEAIARSVGEQVVTRRQENLALLSQHVDGIKDIGQQVLLSGKDSAVGIKLMQQHYQGRSRLAHIQEEARGVPDQLVDVLYRHSARETLVFDGNRVAPQIQLEPTSSMQNALPVGVIERNPEVGKPKHVLPIKQRMPLSKEDLEILWLYCAGDYSRFELAEVLNIPVKSVRKVYMRLYKNWGVTNKLAGILAMADRGYDVLEKVKAEYDPSLVATLDKDELTIVSTMARNRILDRGLAARLGMSAEHLRVYFDLIFNKLDIRNQPLAALLYLAYEQDIAAGTNLEESSNVDIAQPLYKIPFPDSLVDLEISTEALRLEKQKEKERREGRGVEVVFQRIPTRFGTIVTGKEYAFSIHCKTHGRDDDVIAALPNEIQPSRWAEYIDSIPSLHGCTRNCQKALRGIDPLYETQKKSHFDDGAARGG